MNISKYFLFLLLIASSCKQVDNPKVQFLKWAQKGVVIDKVLCMNDANQSYSLYLPSNYNVDNAYPVFYAFDPHGNGRIPVVLMKNSAEKLGFIVVGSNNSRNGISSDEIYSIVNKLLTDTKQKISIDTSRIYTAGFSGGARVACMVAQSIAAVKGVISCSAGLQLDSKPIGFRYIGIAGTQDMNYMEVRQSANFLESVHKPHQILIFEGKHQWPSESCMSEAISMLELYAMKDFLIPMNKNLIGEYNLKCNNRLSILMSANSPDSLALAFMLVKRNVDMLDGLADVTTNKTALELLLQNSKLQKYLNDKLALENYESQKQKEYSSSFGSKTEAWWDNEIRLINEAINLSSSGLTVDVSKRLLGFISLNCFGYVNGALHYNDWKSAAYFTSIYRQVDPENPDCWYAMACLQANTSKSHEALESIKKALKFGYKDFSKLQTDPLLKRLNGLVEFNAIIKR